MIDISWIDWKVTAFYSWSVTHISDFVVTICIPRGVLSIYLVRYFIHFNRKLYIFKKKKLSFWTKIRHIAYPRCFKVSFGPQCCSSWIPIVWFSCVRLHHVAVQAKCFFGIEWINVRRVRIRD